MPSRANRRRASRRRNSRASDTKVPVSAPAVAIRPRRPLPAHPANHTPFTQSAPTLIYNASVLIGQIRTILALVDRSKKQKVLDDEPVVVVEEPAQENHHHCHHHKCAEPATVESALEKSCNGEKLISFEDLPPAWQGTPYVRHGYRFIPLESWPAIVRSMFTFNNEFLNIQTHVITFIWTLRNYLPVADLGELIIVVAVLFCLSASILGHTMGGCSHRGAMEMCGRIDYIGIVWLLCACNATLVFYGFAAYPHIAYPFLGLSALMAFAGSTLPLLSWFNAHENRNWRLGFFITLKTMCLLPILGIWHLYGLAGMKEFLLPFLRPVALSALGIVFFTYHLPERFMDPNGKWARRFDSVGFGSHAIWHVLSVLSITDWSIALGVVRHSFAARAYA
ncbi:hypothetical protein HMN09_00379100 [Mycena chlorophos]|uniref:HlyIII-domain-containing protein n=1 Tax=Mycena chlorophos TaxID=658473 RepID=A0A8H6WHC5_MYCCL|nr:hypothetical protein HMN09_00379100 [Mycena chlorophos]